MDMKKQKNATSHLPYLKARRLRLQKTLAETYEIGDILGEGGFGRVFKAVHRINKKEVAIKVIKKDKVNNPATIITEIEALKMLDHPNMVKLYEYFESKKKIYLVMELLDGEELYERMVKQETFKESDAKKIFKEILDCINFIHKHNISHRDIKPENFMFVSKESNNLKLLDFGLASSAIITEQVGVSDVRRFRTMQSVVGTTWYMAPEVFNQRYNEKCDIWSAGVILYILLCGYPPFFGDSKEEIISEIKKSDLQFDDEAWENVSDLGKDMIKSMLSK